MLRLRRAYTKYFRLRRAYINNDTNTNDNAKIDINTDANTYTDTNINSKSNASANGMLILILLAICILNSFACGALVSISYKQPSCLDVAILKYSPAARLY